MATRKILFRGQTRLKGERTSISGIPLPGIWVAGGVFPQNKGYDYAIIYQQNPKVEKYVVHADTIGQYNPFDSLSFLRLYAQACLVSGKGAGQSRHPDRTHSQGLQLLAL